MDEPYHAQTNGGTGGIVRVNSDTKEIGRLYGATRSQNEQQADFLSGRIPVAVYGLGKMGLPIAAAFADVCGNVTGADVDPTVVDSINAGECHISREPGLASLVEESVSTDALRAKNDPVSVASEATVHVIIVPTLLTESDHPDLSIVEAVANDIANGLKPGDIVFVESTVPPRTCRDLLIPILANTSDLSLDQFGVAFCPERTRSGDALENIRESYPKIIGSKDDESERVAKLVYTEITENDVITVADTTTAEAVKIFEGVYRDVNIALANELAKYGDSMGIDVREAIGVANTQPLCDIHDPGPGVGGHCIPYYPYFLLNGVEGVNEDVGTLFQIARNINDSMPSHTVDILESKMRNFGLPLTESTVLVIGLTYRPDIEETRNSPAHGVIADLKSRGADVLGLDPVLDDSEISRIFDVEPVTIEASYDRDIAAVVTITAHSEFTDINWNAFDKLVILDGRNDFHIDGSKHHVFTLGSGAA